MGLPAAAKAAYIGRRMDDSTREALEAIEEAKALLPSDGPVVLSAEYLRLIERVAALPENQPGTDKTWTERVLAEWQYLVENARKLPPG